MSLLTDADIASMRSTLEQSLPDTAVIKTRSFVDNQGGGGTIGWASAGTVDCRVTPLATVGSVGMEREIADRIAEDSDWMITVPAETSVREEDQIIVGTRTFNVTALRAPRSWELSRRLEATEVK